MSNFAVSEDFERQLREMNEALLLSSVHQHELTEQAEQAEAAMRESEERYRTLFDLGPVAVYSCDSSGTIQKFNRRAAELWGREPAVGDTVERFCGSFKLFRPDGSFMPHAQCSMAEVLNGRVAEVCDAEVTIERPDGSRVVVLVNIRALKNQRGEVAGAINCFSDITDRKRAEEALRESEKQIQLQAASLTDLHRRKDEFLAMLSHELRNPLAPIVNALHLLHLETDEDQLHRQAREIIERQVGQLTLLINDLLEVSRITSGRIHRHQESLALNAIVENAVETVRPLIGQRGQALHRSLSPQPMWLNADAARLEQVVVNLLTNAAKYSNEGGHIWLSTEREGDAAVLRVRDTGVGIAPVLLPRIFDLFTQAERSLDRAQGGLGIGLSLVQRLVEMHGGTVEVQSSLGQGSEFVVRLPVIPVPEIPASLEKEPSESAGSALRVLVVDDRRDATLVLETLLKVAGHDVRTADDGPSGLQAALDYRPNVVLLDIGLPGMNGLEVAMRIRRESTLGGVVLIAMTGYGQEADHQRSLAAGFDHHLVKPADFRKLQKILATVKPV